jgi:hypothetical protein
VYSLLLASSPSPAFSPVVLVAVFLQLGQQPVSPRSVAAACCGHLRLDGSCSPIKWQKQLQACDGHSMCLVSATLRHNMQSSRAALSHLTASGTHMPSHEAEVAVGNQLFRELPLG